MKRNGKVLCSNPHPLKKTQKKFISPHQTQRVSITFQFKQINIFFSLCVNKLNVVWQSVIVLIFHIKKKNFFLLKHQTQRYSKTHQNLITYLQGIYAYLMEISKYFDNHLKRSFFLSIQTTVGHVKLMKMPISKFLVIKVTLWKPKTAKSKWHGNDFKFFVFSFNYFTIELYGFSLSRGYFNLITLILFYWVQLLNH